MRFTRVFLNRLNMEPDADDTDKLLEKPFGAIVSIEAGTGGYSDSNKIKSFLFEAATPAKPSAPKPAAAAKSAAKPANPWD